MTFYKTLFARMGNIKAGKYVSDEGEDLNDTEKVLKKNGISLRKSTNEFRDFGDVLDEVAGKWDKYDNVTQHAIATAFAGTRQQEKFFVLMENYGKALEYETVAAESAGTANQKYTDAYLNSIEARKNAMIAAFESLSQTILSSDLVKTVYTILEKIITALDWILNTTAGKFLSTVIAVTTATAALVSLVSNVPALIQVIGVGLGKLVLKLLGVQTTAAGAAASVSILNVALLGIGAILGIAAGEIAVISALEEKAAKARQEAIDTWDAEAESAKKLAVLYKQYKELEQGSSEYLTVEKSITDLLGDKAEKLKSVTQGTDDYRAALDKLVETEDKKYKKDASAAAVAAEQELSKRKFLPWNSDYWPINGETLDITRYNSDGNKTGFLTLLALARYALVDPNGAQDALNNITSGFPSIAFRNFNPSVQGSFKDYQTITRYLEMFDKSIENLDDLDQAKIRSSLLYSPYAKVKDNLESKLEQIVEKYLDVFALDEDTDFVTEEDRNNFKDKIKEKFGKIFGEETVVGSFFGAFFDKVFDKKIPEVEVKSAENEGVVKKIQNLFDTLTGEDFKKAESNVDTLTKAIEEMDGAGNISLDTAEKLAELGEEYTRYLYVENGQIKVNTDLLRAKASAELISAKYTAISNGATKETIELYDMLIEQSKQLGNLSNLNRALSLIEYENTILEFVGGAGYDKRRLDNYDLARQGILKQIANERSKGKSSDDESIISLYKQYIEYSEKMIKLNDEISEQESEEIKSAIEAENEELEKQKELYDDIVETRKKALNVLKEEADYQKNLAEKQKSVADLQTQLATARLDTSASGRARVRQLEEELANAQQELDEFNLEHAVDLISDKLDAEQEENERIYEQQKADNDARLDKLIEENEKSSKEFAQNVKDEIDLVKDALGGINDSFAEDGGVNSRLKSIQDIIEDILEKLDSGKPTIKTWKQEGILVTEEDYGLTMPEDLIYDARKKQKKQYAIRTHHSGGIVDDLKLGDNEVFAKLLKGEYVATPNQMTTFLRKTLPNMMSVGGSQQFNAPLITVTCGSVTEDSLPKLETIIKNAADKVKSELTAAFDKTGFRSSNKRILSYNPT